MTKLILAILLVFFGAGSSIAADISCTSREGEACLIAKFSGEIFAGDEAKAGKFFANNSRLLYLDLDSVGGNLNAAMQIGREVRARNLLTFVKEEESVCHSACFFVWFAGVYRSGDPGIHRPYSPDITLAGQTFEQSEAFYAYAQQLTEEYLAEIDTYGQLPETFVATMFATPPASMRPLSRVPGVAPGIADTFLPHIEQLILDTCGTVDDASCVKDLFTENR